MMAICLHLDIRQQRPPLLCKSSLTGKEFTATTSFYSSQRSHPVSLLVKNTCITNSVIEELAKLLQAGTSPGAVTYGNQMVKVWCLKN